MNNSHRPGLEEWRQIINGQQTSVLTLAAYYIPTRKLPKRISAPHIRSMGYAVSVHLINNMTEMHAVKICDPDKQHIARSLDGIKDADQYKTACILAEMVGVELEDG